MIIDGIIDEHETAKKQDTMMIDSGKLTFDITRTVQVSTQIWDY